MKILNIIILIGIFLGNINCNFKGIQDNSSQQQINESDNKKALSNDKVNQELDLNKVKVDSHEDELLSTNHVQPQDAIYDNEDQIQNNIDNERIDQDQDKYQKSQKLNQKENQIDNQELNPQQKIKYETPNGQVNNQYKKKKLSLEDQRERLRQVMLSEDNQAQYNFQFPKSDCNFQNVIITLGDIFHTSQKIGDSQLKLSFVSPYKCLKTPALIIKTDQQEFVFKFQLYDIFVSKIFPLDQENNSKFYIRYSYIAYIKGIGELVEFDYDLLRDLSNRNQIARSLRYKSNVLKVNKTGDLKFITYGDQPLDSKGKFLLEQIAKEDFDMLILLGDLSYNLQDNYGTKGDEYFDMIEQISTSKPVQFINGNNDMEDLGRILNYRVLQPGCITKDQNNFYTFELAKTYFYFYNTDFYSNYSSNTQFERINKIAQEHSQNEDKMKLLFTHRSLNCFDYKNQEGCYTYSGKYYDQYRKYFKDLEIDIHFAAHIHMYQRFEQKQIEDILKTGDNQEGQRIGQITIINGSGGQIEDQSDFTKERTNKVEGLEYYPNELGYVLVTLKNFDQVTSKFYSVTDMFNQRDNQAKEMDSMEYFKFTPYLNRLIIL